jgi:hypothetical protein
MNNSITDTLVIGRGYRFDARFLQETGEIEKVKRWATDNDYALEFVSIVVSRMPDGSGVVMSAPKDYCYLAPKESDKV